VCARNDIDHTATESECAPPLSAISLRVSARVRCVGARLGSNMG
jgi:hypothetical protein